MSLDPTSPQGKLASAMFAIFPTAAGAVLRENLTAIANASPVFGPRGEFRDALRTMYALGRQDLARELLLAADVDAPLIGG